MPAFSNLVAAPKSEQFHHLPFVNPNMRVGQDRGVVTLHDCGMKVSILRRMGWLGVFAGANLERNKGGQMTPLPTAWKTCKSRTTVAFMCGNYIEEPCCLVRSSGTRFSLAREGHFLKTLLSQKCTKLLLGEVVGGIEHRPI